MKYLVLDIASKSGWAIYEDNKLISYGAKNLKINGKPLGEKMVKTYEFVERLVIKNKIDIILQEDFVIRRFYTATLRSLGAQGYAIIYYSFINNIEYYAISINRKYTKENAKKYVEALNLKDFKELTEDTMDAICLGNYWITNKSWIKKPKGKK